MGRLQLEIERAIEGWLPAQQITLHAAIGAKGFVTYSSESVPPSGDPTDVFRMRRWLRKRLKYQHQAEYRLAWLLSSKQLENMPETVDVELSMTGLSQFRPWTPCGIAGAVPGPITRLHRSERLKKSEPENRSDSRPDEIVQQLLATR